jgi:hypothetical protein
MPEAVLITVVVAALLIFIVSVLRGRSETRERPKADRDARAMRRLTAEAEAERLGESVDRNAERQMLRELIESPTIEEESRRFAQEHLENIELAEEAERRVQGRKRDGA